MTKFGKTFGRITHKKTYDRTAKTTGSISFRDHGGGLTVILRAILISILILVFFIWQSSFFMLMSLSWKNSHAISSFAKIRKDRLLAAHEDVQPTFIFKSSLIFLISFYWKKQLSLPRLSGSETKKQAFFWKKKNLVKIYSIYRYRTCSSQNAWWKTN